MSLIGIRADATVVQGSVWRRVKDSRGGYEPAANDVDGAEKGAPMSHEETTSTGRTRFLGRESTILIR